MRILANLSGTSRRFLMISMTMTVHGIQSLERPILEAQKRKSFTKHARTEASTRLMLRLASSSGSSLLMISKSHHTYQVESTMHFTLSPESTILWHLGGTTHLRNWYGSILQEQAG